MLANSWMAAQALREAARSGNVEITRLCSITAPIPCTARRRQDGPRRRRRAGHGIGRRNAAQRSKRAMSGMAASLAEDRLTDLGYGILRSLGHRPSCAAAARQPLPCHSIQRPHAVPTDLRQSGSFGPGQAPRIASAVVTKELVLYGNRYPPSASRAARASSCS